MSEKSTTNTCCVSPPLAELKEPLHIPRMLPDATHRCFLALDGRAVEAQSGNAVGLPLDVEDALVVPLSRLRLRQVLGG